MTTAMSSKCAPHRATRPSGAPSAVPRPSSFPHLSLSLPPPLLRPSVPPHIINTIISYHILQLSAYLSHSVYLSGRGGHIAHIPSILPCPHGRTSYHLSGASDGGVPTPLHPTGRGVFIPISSRPTAFFSPSPSFLLSSPVTVIYYSPLLIHMAYKTAPRLGWCVGCNSYFVINGDMTCPRCNTPTVTARCTRCGHTWVPSRLAPGVPKYCTKCHSPYYDRTPVRNNSKVRRGSA